ncbi:hypothetical protein MK805_05575 [Shimazuella sp. AN120528]|uniref:MATE family efflux transporter n=1 Tax=Shimazuella soli TaxID=1892854 RepID=UPI001F0E43B2|nr:hypothetical protein [Shimazuella soli]MCH5584436.1 hypothetical protein [Shimazuella soli]
MRKKEHPLKSMARLGWQPTLLVLFFAMEGIIDTFFISHIGLSAIETVTIVVESILVIQWCFYAKVGSAIRYFIVTAKSEAEALRIIIQGVCQCCALSLAFGVGTILLAKQLFVVYGVEITSTGLLYLQVVGGTCILSALFSVITNGLQGWLKEQWSTTAAQVAMIITHLGLDYVLIYLQHLGLAGAACASVLSSLLGTGLILARFFHKAGGDLHWKLDWKLQKSILSQAFPLTFASFLNQLMMVPYFAILAWIGPEYLAAVRTLYVVQRVFYLSWMGGIVSSISLAIGPMIENKKQVARYIRWALGTVVIGTLLSWTVLLVMAEPAVGLVTDNTTVIKLTVRLLLLYALVQCPWTIYQCVGEVLGVHKQTQTASIIYILSSVLFGIACWLLPKTLVGVSFAEIIQYMFLGIVSTAYLCGYFKHAGIELFPIRAAFERVLSFWRPRREQVNQEQASEVIFTRDFSQTALGESQYEARERLVYRKYLTKFAGSQGLTPSSFREMAPVFRAIRAYNALRSLESAKRGPVEDLPVDAAMENAEMFLRDALNTIATKRNLQSFLEFLTGAEWKPNQSTARAFFAAFVQHAKVNATTPTDIRGVDYQLAKVPSLRGEIVRDANVHAVVDFREARAKIDQLTLVAA